MRKLKQCIYSRNYTLNFELFLANDTVQYYRDPHGARWQQLLASIRIML